MDKVTHQVRCEQWTKIINECLASGMNKTAWCKANAISDKSLQAIKSWELSLAKKHIGSLGNHSRAVWYVDART